MSMQSALHSSGGAMLHQALRPTYEHSGEPAPPLASDLEMVRNGTSATEIGQDTAKALTNTATDQQSCLNKVTNLIEIDENA